MKRFGAMLDMSRNAVMKPSEVKKFADILRSFGYNTLMLYTEDTYEVENEPYFGYLRGRYTKDELKDIVDHCDKSGIEVIPCIQTLAHLNQIFRWAPYACVNDTADILLVGEDKTYELIENMFKTVKECFRSEYIHIGMDEAWSIGRGNYLTRNGYEDKSVILQKHLKKVVEIARKYNLKPLIWSDMFFKLATNSWYYGENVNVTEEIKSIVPKEVSLVYWDYIHTEKEEYDRLIGHHREFNNDVWFAGGAWTWTGFAPNNRHTLKSMLPAMQSAKEHGIENVFLAAWGDNGKECSFYSVLPSFYAAKRVYDGETDMQKIKSEFYTLTGEDFDAFLDLDLPNLIDGGPVMEQNPVKHMLYSDPFNGFLDVTVKDNGGEKYAAAAKVLRQRAINSKYDYIFKSISALCELMSVKYDLGLETRRAYQAHDNDKLAFIVKKYKLCENLLEKFYTLYKSLWYKENKPHGFDVQDLRLGGLSRRLSSCCERLEKYLSGEEKEIPELEEKLLSFYGKGETNTVEDTAALNVYTLNATVNVF